MEKLFTSHLAGRFSHHPKKGTVDHFMHAFMMAKIQASNGSGLFRKKAQKKYTEYAKTLYLTEYQTASGSQKEAIENEWVDFSKTYINCCVGNQQYGSACFGMIPLNQQAVNEKIKNEISLVTREYPARLGMEELFRPLNEIMLRTFLQTTKASD